MRIHTNTLTAEDFRDAGRIAGVSFARLTEHGSRTRARAFDFILEGTGAPGNSGRYGAYGDRRSASWDHWGIVLGELYRRDPGAVVPRVYESGEHFRWATGGRFDTLTPAGVHKRHRWELSGTAATGSYRVSSCACGAIRRDVAAWRGHTWGEIAGGAA